MTIQLGDKMLPLQADDDIEEILSSITRDDDIEDTGDDDVTDETDKSAEGKKKRRKRGRGTGGGGK